mgnify:CR=1 FL=1
MASSMRGDGVTTEQPRKALIQGARASAALPREEATGVRRNLDLVLDIPVQLTVELGQTRLRIEELIALKPGTILDLDRRAGEPVDLRIQGHLVARGEVVLVDGGLGVQITGLAETPQRLSSFATPGDGRT